MSKKKTSLVPNPCVTTGMSDEEEIRALTLADIALQNPTATDTQRIAGNRATTGHRQLVEELQDKVDEIYNRERAA